MEGEFVHVFSPDSGYHPGGGKPHHYICRERCSSGACPRQASHISQNRSPQTQDSLSRSVKELRDSSAPFAGHFEHGHVAGTSQLDEFRIGYEPVEGIAVDGRNEPIVLAPDDHSWGSMLAMPGL